MKHILSAEQFSDKNYLENLFAHASDMEAMDKQGKLPQLLSGKIVATLFYEPSTRTRLSFESAVLKLGGNIISMAEAKTSSLVKGESLEDTIRVVSDYADLVVLRHPEEGAAASIAAVSRVPIINAGDGTGQHPTQALLDLYTIKKELGRLDNLTIAIVGDLLYGRTVHSLLPLLAVCQNIKLYLISPSLLSLPEENKSFLKAKRMDFNELDSLDEVMSELDILYVTRIQKERFPSQAEYEKLKGSYRIDIKTIKRLKQKAIIMHPLPRVDEIAREVDSDPRAAYFRQAKNGLYVRMALLADILS